MDESKYSGVVDKIHALNGGVVTEDYIVLAYHNGNENRVYMNYISRADIKNKNTSIGVVEKAYSGLGHANDMTYNPVTKEIYVTSGDLYKIGVINSTSKELKTSISVTGDAKGFGEIAYNASNNNKYYVFTRALNSGGNTDYYMFEFNKPSSSLTLNTSSNKFVTDSPNSLGANEAAEKLLSHLGTQGMSIYNNLVYVEWWHRHTNDTLNGKNTKCKGYKHNNYIFVYNLKGQIQKILFIPNTRDRNNMATSALNQEPGVYMELESIDFDEDGNMILAFARALSQTEAEVSSHTQRYRVNVYQLSRFKLLNYGTVDENKKIIKKIPVSTKYGQIKNKISTYGTVAITNATNQNVSDNGIVKSGDNLKLTLENSNITYKMSVTGDTTGDGVVNKDDVTAVIRYIIDKTGLSDSAIYAAADVDDNSNIKMNDAMRILKMLH